MMPTFEERLEVLERARSIMAIEHISDVRQLDERITALHQQLAEQKQRLAEQEQALGQSIRDLHQKVDTLATTGQLNGLVTELRQKFDANDHYVTITRGIVEGQQQDIRETKTELHDFKEETRECFDKIDLRFNKVDERFDKMDLRFDQVISLLQKKG